MTWASEIDSLLLAVGILSMIRAITCVNLLLHGRRLLVKGGGLVVQLLVSIGLMVWVVHLYGGGA